MGIWKDATKFYKTSYTAWIAYTDVLMYVSYSLTVPVEKLTVYPCSKKSLHADARKVFKDIAGKNLDWPEMVWEAWLAFEQLHGSVKEIEDALDRIQRARTQVNAKRAKVRRLSVISVRDMHSADELYVCRKPNRHRRR